jgi:hypothetical protein
MWPFKPNIDALERKGDWPGLIKASRHGSAGVRVAATKALGAAATPETFEAVVWRLGDAYEGVRATAVKVLQQSLPLAVAPLTFTPLPVGEERIGSAAPFPSPLTGEGQGAGGGGGAAPDLDVARQLVAVVSLAAADDERTRARKARAWRSNVARVTNGVVALLGEMGGQTAAVFLADAAAGRYPHVDSALAEAALAEMKGLDGAHTIVAALQSQIETIGLEKDSADEQRLALLARVVSRQAAAAHLRRDADQGATFAREIVRQAVAVLDRVALRPHAATAAIDGLGVVGSGEAVAALGRLAVGDALAAFPNEIHLRTRAVRALVEARRDAPEEIMVAVNRQLASALRLAGGPLRPVREAAVDALRDWTPDNADDHAWFLAAKGLFAEAAELGAPAVPPLVESIRDATLPARERAVEALIGLDLDQALSAVRSLADDPSLDDAARSTFRRALDRAEARTYLAALRSPDAAARRAAARWLADHRLEPDRGSLEEAYFLAAREEWETLVERGAVAVEVLRAAASEPQRGAGQTWTERSLAAAVALAQLGRDEACEYLSPVVRAGGSDQARAIDALVELGTDRAALTLAAALGKVPDSRPLHSALVTIGEPAVGALQPALEANDLVLNRLAAEIVRAIGHEPADATEAGILAVAAGDWNRAVEAGPAAAEPLRRFLQRAARQQADYDLLTRAATALARVAPVDELLAVIDDAKAPLEARLPLAAGLARAGHSLGVDRLLRWLFAAPREWATPPLPWLTAVMDEVADRMGVPGEVGRAMVAAATYARAPILLGDDAVGVRADTAAGAEAVAALADVPGERTDVTAVANVLNLVSEMPDAEVTLARPDYAEALRVRVDFGPRRAAALQALRKLGKPIYDPDGYFGVMGE